MFWEFNLGTGEFGLEISEFCLQKGELDLEKCEIDLQRGYSGLQRGQFQFFFFNFEWVAQKLKFSQNLATNKRFARETMFVNYSSFYSSSVQYFFYSTVLDHFAALFFP